MVDFFDLLKSRRSVRDYQDKEVSLDLVKEMIKECCLAPSSGNAQPWQFIIVNNKDWIKRLSDESKKNILAYIEENPDTPVKQYESVLRVDEFNVFYNAPCLVYIGGSKKVRSLDVDCALAACYLMFSAQARGLATCWIGLGMNIKAPEIVKELAMPGDFRIVAPIIVGYQKGLQDIPQRFEPRILSVVS